MTGPGHGVRDVLAVISAPTDWPSAHLPENSSLQEEHKGLAWQGWGLIGLQGRPGTRPEIRAGDTRRSANRQPSARCLPFQKSTGTKPAQLCAATKQGQ